MTNPLLESHLHSLPLLARGKVRDNYAVGSDRLLMIASDRLSAFDVVMGQPIPGKGELLTSIERPRTCSRSSAATTLVGSSPVR